MEQIYSLIGTISPGQVGKQITLQEKTVTLGTTEQEITADAGYDGLSLVTVPGVSLQDKTVNLSSAQQTISADAGYNGLGTVTVPGMSLQDKTVTPTSAQQVITADTGYDGLGTVTVDASSGGTDTFNELFNSNPASVGAKSVTMIDGGGHTCYGLSAGYSVTLPNTVTSISSGAFTGQEALQDISGQTVTSIGTDAFSACTGLSSANFPNVLTIGGNAFTQCSALMSFVANSIGTNGIGQGAFSYSGLASARFGNSLMSIPDYCFDGCSSLIDLWLGGPPPTLGVSALDVSGVSLTVHVRSSRLADYQNNQEWQDEIQRIEDELGSTITIVGDYE